MFKIKSNSNRNCLLQNVNGPKVKPMFMIEFAKFKIACWANNSKPTFR